MLKAPNAFLMWPWKISTDVLSEKMVGTIREFELLIFEGCANASICETPRGLQSEDIEFLHVPLIEGVKFAAKRPTCRKTEWLE